MDSAAVRRVNLFGNLQRRGRVDQVVGYVKREWAKGASSQEIGRASVCNDVLQAAEAATTHSSQDRNMKVIPIVKIP